MDTLTKKRVQVQVSVDLYNRVDKILDAVGLTCVAAVNMFYKKIEAEGGIPFDVKIPKKRIFVEKTCRTYKECKRA